MVVGKKAQLHWMIIIILVLIVLGLMYYPAITKQILTSAASAAHGLAGKAQNFVK